jgi:glycosyltransferase involved in cell wall biosynthesis
LLRILHVTPYYHPSIGGLQHHVKALSDHLAGRGHEVTVFTDRLSGSANLRVDAGLPSLERVGAVTVRRFTGHGGIPRLLLRIPGAYRTLRTLLGADYYRMLADGPWLPQALVAAVRLRPDVVLVASAEHEALLLQFALLRHLSSARLVALPLLHLQHAWSQSPLIVRYLSRFHAVVANTEYEKAFIDRVCPRGPSSRAVGVGVAPEHFRHRDGRAIRERYGLGDDRVVGYVARLEPEKGAVKLIEAMRLVWREEPGTRLLLAGHRFDAGSAADRALRVAVDALSPTERSRLTLVNGFPESEKASIFDACDVFAMPSIAESFGIAYLEAWLCAKPVIGARIGAVQCVIEDGRDGLLVDPEDAGGLAGAILKLVRDADLRQRLGRRGQEKTLARFTWARITDAIEAVYLEAIERSTASPR